MAADTGWPLSWIVGGVSVGFLVSGLVSPRVGRIVEARGGRPVLMASAALLAMGLLVLGLAPSLSIFVVGWMIMGLGMGAGLYDPAFSTLGRLYGDTARNAISQVTLFGGFASTICWPLSAYLVEHLGWRGACLTYAAVHACVVLPLYFFSIPREPARAPARHEAMPSEVPNLPRREDRFVFGLLATGFTLAAMTMTVLAVHLLTLMQAQGMTATAAVALCALIGPSQVGARVAEMTLARRAHPVWSLLASAVLVAVGLSMLLGSPAMAAVGIVFYGAGSGIRSIARGTVPLALFGRDGYAVLMGRIAMPALLAQAAAPLLGAWAIERWGSTQTLVVLGILSAFNIVLVAALVPVALRR